jgi:hypothetical protein
VTTKATLTRVVTQGDNTVLNGTITVKNTASIPVNVLGSVYQVRGVKLGPDRKENFTEPLTDLDLDRQIRGSPEPARKQDKVLQAAPLVSPESFLERDEEITRNFNVYVPKGYDDAEVSVYLIVSRRKLALSREGEPPAVSADQIVTFDRRIEGDSWIRGVTRDKRYMHLKYALLNTGPIAGCSLGGVLYAWVDRDETHGPDEDRGCGDYSLDLADYYGIVGTSTGAEVSLAPPQK